MSGGLAWWHAVLRPTAIGVLTLFGTLAAAATVPMLLGWHTTVVASGSMMPALRPGDALVSAPTDARLVRPHQIVLSDDPGHPGQLLSHRVVRVRADGSFVTRGDANAVADSTPIRPQTVHGVARLVVPRVGLPVLWLHQRDLRLVVFVAVLAGAAALVAAPARPRPARP